MEEEGPDWGAGSTAVILSNNRVKITNFISKILQKVNRSGVDGTGRLVCRRPDPYMRS